MENRVAATGQRNGIVHIRVSLPTGNNLGEMDASA